MAESLCCEFRLCFAGSFIIPANKKLLECIDGDFRKKLHKLQCFAQTAHSLQHWHNCRKNIGKVDRKPEFGIQVDWNYKKMFINAKRQIVKWRRLWLLLKHLHSSFGKDDRKIQPRSQRWCFMRRMAEWTAIDLRSNRKQKSDRNFVQNHK